MAGLVQGLSLDHDVTVVTWGISPQESAPVELVTLGRDTPKSRFSGFLRPRPRLVQQLIGPRGRMELNAFVSSTKFDAIMYSHSYLAAALPLGNAPTIVDLANVESERLRAFAREGRGLNRASAALEHVKARRWEPRVVRDAGLVTALSEVDLQWAQRFTSSALLVPNGVARQSSPMRSPRNGYALYVASLDYEPNRSGARFLVEEVWPRVRARINSSELVIAGRGSREFLGEAPGPGIRVVGEVASLDQTYEGSSIVLAPVSAGAGRQLKVIEGLARGRTMVCTPYSFDSVPEGLRDLVKHAANPQSFADAAAELMTDTAARWTAEEKLAAREQWLPTWDRATKDLRTWVDRR